MIHRLLYLPQKYKKSGMIVSPKKETKARQFIMFAAVVLGGMAILYALLRMGYGVAWTGFGDYALPRSDYVRGKTLWDWMELLIIPLILAVGAFILQRSESAVEREIAVDRQQEAALQAYLDRMGDLLLSEKLQEAASVKALNVMRVRTLTVLRELNAARNGIVVRFLRDIGLAGQQESKLFVAANLEGADLKEVNLSQTNLENARLKGADLEKSFFISANLQDAILPDTNLERAHMSHIDLNGAVLTNANLQFAGLYKARLQHTNLVGVNLKGANLVSADLEGANMDGVNLEGNDLRSVNLKGASLQRANLKGAQVSDEQLATVRSLKGAIMPDGTIHA